MRRPRPIVTAALLAFSLAVTVLIGAAVTARDWLDWAGLGAIAYGCLIAAWILWRSRPPAISTRPSMSTPAFATGGVLTPDPVLSRAREVCAKSIESGADITVRALYDAGFTSAQILEYLPDILSDRANSGSRFVLTYDWLNAGRRASVRASVRAWLMTQGAERHCDRLADVVTEFKQFLRANAEPPAADILAERLHTLEASAAILVDICRQTRSRIVKDTRRDFTPNAGIKVADPSHRNPPDPEPFGGGIAL